jgi:hypothetical protein
MRKGNEAGAVCLLESERTVGYAVPFTADWSRVRLYRRGCAGVAGQIRGLVLRASRNRAVALGNHVFLPDRCEGDLGVLAHELTHCAQYQAWGPLTYFARGAAAQVRDLLHRRLRLGSSPYRYEVQPGKPLSAYGMEQQAQIVEDRFRSSNTNQAVPSA